MLSPFAEASENASGIGKSPLPNVTPDDLKTNYYFRVTPTNTGEPEVNDYYRGCTEGNVESACPDTEMNIGVLRTPKAVNDNIDGDDELTEENSDNSRLVLEGNKGIRLTKSRDEHTAHKITFDAPVEAAEGSNAIKIEQPTEGKKAGHTIIKSEIKSGTPDKIGVESKDGVTTIKWIGGDTSGGAAGGSTPVTAGNGVSVDAATNKVSVQGGNGVTVDASGVSVKAKDKGGVTVDGSGVSVNTDGTTIAVDTATGNVKAVTGTINNEAGNAKAKDGDDNKLTTVANVAEAINAAKVKEGSGISVAHNAALNTYTVSAPFEKTENDKGTTVTFKGKITTGHPNGETKLSGIAAGEVSATSTDAINGSQLYAVSNRLSNNMNKLNDRINKVGKHADAGMASAIATANLLQSYRPGLSAATAAVGQYRGQSAVAVGYSRLSDNGKYGVKLSLGANTQGNVGAGVAYFW